jgi:glucose-6-phosphate isomerase
MLTIDYANCLTDRVGPHGLEPDTLAPGSPAAERARELTARLEKTKGTGWEKWRDLPFDPARSANVGAVKEVAESLRGRFDNLVVLGIGGSALGNIALQSALNPPTWNLIPNAGRGGPRLFVVDNVDPANLGAILRFLQGDDPGLERTCFNVISKSGETAETASQFMIIRRLLMDALGEAEHGKNIVAITDAAKGTMRTICDQAGYTTLPVPEGVGGRFSVLSPVGLFSAAMCGIDIDALLDGAAAMDARCSTPDLAKNPAAMLATLLYNLSRTAIDHGPVGDPSGGPKTIHVMMPYANGLYLLADWFRQLWAESLGKRSSLDGEDVFRGWTPVKALGTTDQHSQVQLYREGPNDKVYALMEVESFGDQEIEIPAGLGVDALSYLEGQKMGGLLNAEKRATEFALVESQRPNLTIRFPRVDAEHVGEFICLWEMVTAYAGLMLNVDAYDQPAVETGKVATFGLMGREGYGEWKEKVEGTLRSTDRMV